MAALRCSETVAHRPIREVRARGVRPREFVRGLSTLLWATWLLAACGGGSSGADPAPAVAPVPAVALAAAAADIPPGTATQLNWSSTNATACTASGGWTGARDVSGVAGTGSLTSTTTFVLSCTGPGGAASASVSVTVTAPPSASQSNILVIISDDIGAESLSLVEGLSGASDAVATPNLTRLASDGLVFDNAWAYPVCSPTRATILTGQYGHRTGVLYAGDPLAATAGQPLQETLHR